MERSFDWLWDKYKEGARDKFEEVCYKIYKNEHPDAEVKRVRVQHGCIMQDKIPSKCKLKFQHPSVI